MIDFAKTLAELLASDPLGLLESQERAPVVSPDERLIASFSDINSFYAERGREPGPAQEVHEYMLYSRLSGIRENSEKIAVLLQHDAHGLLAGFGQGGPATAESLDELLADDPLGLLGGDPDEEELAAGILRLTHVKKPAKQPDMVARRRPCREFHQFEPIFKQVHAALKSGERVTVQAGREGQIVAGAVFILKGALVYVATVGKKSTSEAGKENARTYCVFENGTEADMYLRSLATALLKAPHSREVVAAKRVESLQCTGYVYVLRSLSTDPRISGIEDLFKIGFSAKPVEDRLRGAENEPTYLLAPVRIVATFQTFDLDPRKLENFLHRFFSAACLDIEVAGAEGRTHSPREWFVVPYFAIETAVELLVSGEIGDYQYDSDSREIVSK